jgi:hypothetical protein
MPLTEASVQAIATYGKVTLWAQLLTNVTATDTGQWLPIKGWHPLTIEFNGIGTATLQVRGSNTKAAPADSDDGFQLGSDIATDSLVALDAPIKWIKVKVSSYSSGTINAYMMASPQG